MPARVENPRVPTVLFRDPLQARVKALAMSRDQVEPLGRKLRHDAHIVAGFVGSYPAPVSEVEGDDHEFAVLQQWVAKTRAYACPPVAVHGRESACLPLNSISGATLE